MWLPCLRSYLVPYTSKSVRLGGTSGGAGVIDDDGGDEDGAWLLESEGALGVLEGDIVCAFTNVPPLVRLPLPFRRGLSGLETAGCTLRSGLVLT